MSLRNPNYAQLWDTMIPDPGASTVIRKAADMIVKGKERYETVSRMAQVAINGSFCPWYVIGIIHLLECGLNWGKHLHNGDPLKARTVRVPPGRPRKGEPPFTWEQSATDAIRMMDFNNKNYDWSSIPFVLQKLEEYNGLGYTFSGTYTPYLWSMTNHYTKGKYTADGKFDPNQVSVQVGGAPILKLLLT